MKKLYLMIRNQLIPSVMDMLRDHYQKQRRKHLVNPDPTIISSDCFGGLVYHALGLPFRSPTVNLYFLHDEFPVFVQHLREYLAAELVRVDDPSVSFPVGELEYGGRKIRVHFMHYSTFDEAKAKWDERKQRVDLSNIYIVQTVPAATEAQIRAFDALPYRNKMLITGKNLTNSKNVCTHRVFLKTDYRRGEFLEYKSEFSLKRYMDEIDYIGFLNRSN